MPRLVWDKTGEHFYETGVENGVLYPFDTQTSAYGSGVVWNGLSNVSESPSGAEANAVWADNIKYLNLYSAEEFGATIECYTYPDEFKAMNGEASLASGVTIGQQTRGTFGLSYKTRIGNDVDENLGYKIHLLYGAKASPSEKSYGTINESPEAISMSYELSTIPVPVSGHKPTSLVVIDSTDATPEKMAAIEAILYGSDGTATPTVSGSGTAVVNVATFNAAVDNKAGTYTFSYNGTDWSLDSNVVSLATYGITIGGSFSSGDTIAVAFTAGGSARLPLPDEIATIMA